MQQPKDEQVDTDDVPRKGKDADHEAADHKDDDYRDDGADFAASSDYAKGQPVGHYDGGGPGTSSEHVREKGAQDWQKGALPKAEEAPASVATDGAVKSRSADPGQSSYGGFKDEGPIPEEVRKEQAAALRDEQEHDDGDDSSISKR